ncbi:MAG: glycosyltransferase family 2 protein [Actinomycetota bacterium]
MTESSHAPYVSVVMPAFNESAILESSVGEVVEGLRARDVSFELVVTENGSTDGTLALAHELAEKFPEVRVDHLVAADYGRALRAGLLLARGTAVVNFDTDYYDLDFLETAVTRVTQPDGPAIVVGSKRGVGANDTRPLLRKLVTATFSTLLRVVFRLKVSDTHGMKAMNRVAVEPYARRCAFGKDLFDTELILRVERAGLRTDGIPVAVIELRPARTSILRRVPRTIAGLVKLRIALWRDRDPITA